MVAKTTLVKIITYCRFKLYLYYLPSYSSTPKHLELIIRMTD